MKFYVENDKSSAYTYPCIRLKPDNWDDYSLKTTFIVHYYESQFSHKLIGSTKILYKELEVKDGARDAWTFDFLQSSFEALDENFVSLGQDETYYNNLKLFFGKDPALNILESLRDCGMHREFLNDFSDKRGTKDSLLRSITAENMLNSARKILLSNNFNDAFHFEFEFKPLYNDNDSENLPLMFDSKNEYFPNRVSCIIGENGVGKTQILNQLSEFILKNKLPFNRIIHLTNSYFDKGVQIPKSTYPDYHYFGLINQRSETTIEVISKEEQINELKKVLNKIIKRYKKEIDARLIRDSFANIRTLFPRVNFDEILAFFDDWEGNQKETTIDAVKFIEDFQKLSSGESILLSNLIKILSCIAFNSIFLIDEPEIHLHPNFITSYMEFIYKILNRFDSYALIATHSTFVVREIKADCVFVVRRTKDDFCEIRPVTRQTFGTNAMSLATDIFQNDEIDPYFMTQLKRMVDLGNYTEEQICNFFEINENYKLDIGIRMKIHSLFEEK